MSVLNVIEGVSQTAREKVLNLEILLKEGKTPKNFPNVYKQSLTQFYIAMEEKNHCDAADLAALCITYNKFFSTKEEAKAFSTMVREEFTWGK